MLDIATEITVSVMSFNVGTTILVQTACPIDNSTDSQAVGVYKHYSLMTYPYLLLVTGSLRSNLSRAKCTAQVGMSYRLNQKYWNRNVINVSILWSYHYVIKVVDVICYRHMRCLNVHAWLLWWIVSVWQRTQTHPHIRKRGQHSYGNKAYCFLVR